MNFIAELFIHLNFSFNVFKLKKGEFKFAGNKANLAVFIFLICFAPTITAQDTWEEMVDFDDAVITNIEFINRLYFIALMMAKKHLKRFTGIFSMISFHLIS